LPQTLTPARELAEAAFKKVSHPLTMKESDVEADIIRERTARLRTLRLAKESADKRREKGVRRPPENTKS
jgi:hypothetical protein